MLGVHLPIDNTLLTTIQNSSYPVIQVYLPNEKISLVDQVATGQYCQENHRRIYIHSHLHNNLAKKNANFSIRRLKQDLMTLQEIPGSCVLHVGKACDYAKGKRATSDEQQIALHQVITRLNSLSHYLPSQQQPRLLLENAAGQGTEIGTSWDHFRRITEESDLSSRLGLCFDTQHAFASGLVDMRSSDQVNEIFDEAREIGWKIGLVHLNDSKVDWNSRVDRHQCIGEGYIWNKSMDSLKILLERCREEQVDIILETPHPQNDIKKISKL